MTIKVILYDIPCNIPNEAWSPSVWKVRLILNYKKIPYRTEWVEYPDIKEVCQKIGASPTPTRSGEYVYTLPVIHDLTTDTVISDSFVIAKFLDKTYPDTPPLFSADEESASSSEFRNLTAVQKIAPSLTRLVLFAEYKILNPRSQVFFRATREETYGVALEELVPEAEKKAEWENVKSGFSELYSWMLPGPYVKGNTISFTDINIAANLVRTRKIFGTDSEEWKQIEEWDGGWWKEYVGWFEQYEQIL